MNINKAPKYVKRRRGVAAGVAATVTGAAMLIGSGGSDTPKPVEACEVTVGYGNDISSLSDAAEKLDAGIVGAVDEHGVPIADDALMGRRDVDANRLGNDDYTPVIEAGDVLTAEHVSPNTCRALGGVILAPRR